MIDVTADLITSLELSGLPVFYENFINDTTPIPCITWQEVYNDNDIYLDTMAYSRIQFMVKIWTKRVSDYYTYAKLIDDELSPQGYSRTTIQPLTYNGITQFPMRYTGLAKEDL